MTNIIDHQFVENRTYVLRDGCDEYDYLCEEVKISKVKINVLKGDQFVEITLVKHGVPISVTLSRDLVGKDIVKQLVKVGLTLVDTADNTAALAEVLFRTEAEAETEYFHDSFGYLKDIAGKSLFCGLESLGGTYSSKYLHYDRMKPTGTTEQWCEALQPYIESTPELQLALTIAVAAPINAKLQKCGVLKNVGIYNLYGTTSVGKTTTVELMASVWYGASVGFGIENSNLTANFLDSVVANSQGLPVFVDDMSAAPRFDLTTPIYSISSTLSRGRSRGDGTCQSRLSFSGAVIFTSEKTLISQTSAQEGLTARVLELNCKWYKCGEDAEAITRLVNTYHGTGWKSFMKVLLKKGKDHLLNTYSREYEVLVSKFQPPSGLHRRLLQKCAVLMTAIPYIEEAWNFTMDREAILNILAETYAESQQNLPPEMVLHDGLMAEIAANKNFFPKKNAQIQFSSSAWGEDGEYRGMPCVWITREKFLQLMDKFGYRDHKSACKMLKNAKLMAQFHGNHNFILHRVAGVEVLCAAIYPKHIDPSGTTPKKSKPKVSKIVQEWMKEETNKENIKETER